ncbi:G-type lectin S-receptor-like serine/threonine-protein kinase CES101 [Camellia lanceoleosa]|uniref:G-type lectin S-receptor-like serine/threonine-protein kinase CES101 n=1 Tax=Camellia lanceoleosa TaxID=1840588 RepID=A0ACC0I797_9ERIC|nr:G-type lectin S-receptor-like serine/threonine-protein kinase CES101 [Camellia lanceoleosa]
MNIKMGHSWTLTSWASEVVPDSGALKLGVDPGGANQLVVWRHDNVQWTSGLWKNGSFKKAPELTEKSYEFEFKFVTNGYERYFSYFVKNSSIVAARWEYNSGKIMYFALVQNNGSRTWRFATVSPCHNSVEDGSTVCLKQKPSECRKGSE